MLDLAVLPMPPDYFDASDLWNAIHEYMKNKPKITAEVEQDSTYFNYITHAAFMARSSYSLTKEKYVGEKSNAYESKT